MRKVRFLPPVRINGVWAQGGDFGAVFALFSFYIFCFSIFGGLTRGLKGFRGRSGRSGAYGWGLLRPPAAGAPCYFGKLIPTSGAPELFLES